MKSFGIILHSDEGIESLDNSGARLLGFEYGVAFDLPKYLVSGRSTVRQPDGRVDQSDMKLGVGEIPYGTSREAVISLMVESVITDYSLLFDPEQIRASILVRQ